MTFTKTTETRVSPAQSRAQRPAAPTKQDVVVVDLQFTFGRVFTAVAYAMFSAALLAIIPLAVWAMIQGALGG